MGRVGNGGSEVGKGECRRKKRAKEVTNIGEKSAGNGGVERVGDHWARDGKG